MKRLLFCLALMGCGPTQRPSPVNYDPPIQVGPLAVYYPKDFDGPTRAACTDALTQAYSVVYVQVSPTVAAFFNGWSPTARRAVFVTRGRGVQVNPLSSPSGVGGYVDPSGAIHEPMGEGGTCPDAVELIARSYWPALPGVSKATLAIQPMVGGPTFTIWDWVKQLEAVLVMQLRFQRGLP